MMQSDLIFYPLAWIFLILVDSAVLSALARWQIDFSGTEASRCQARTEAICGFHSQA